jgi:hypothetical protein
MTMIKVSRNKALFDMWSQIKFDIDNLKSIVQNDMELDISEIEDWKRHSLVVLQKMQDLRLRTMKHTSGINYDF